MLQAIRDRATGWIAWAIIILICIPFALWGIHEFNTPDRGVVVARVNDAEIDYYQYRNAYQEQRERLRQMLGGAVPPSMLQDARLREQALEGLISDEVLIQQSVGSGLRVGDAQLASAIATQPSFQENGRFSQQLYENFLRTRGSSAAGFEYDLRRSMLGEQVIAALTRTVIVTEPELDAAMRIRGEERRYRMLEVDPDTIPTQEPASDAIEKHFAGNPEAYVRPEQVSIRYVEMSRDEIANSIEVDEAELRDVYQANLANYRVAEQREARHILVTVDADADDAAVEAGREQILALRERIEAGEDFAEVAKEASQDPGSAPLGGSLGFFGKGLMDPAFEEAAFGLARGTLSEPVRSRFGWHLIEVTDIQPEQVRGFEEARADVLREVQDRDADTLFAEKAERLANLSFEHPESLEVAAETLGLEIRTAGPFSREGDGAAGVAAQRTVRDAAFSDEVLGGGNNSPLLQVGADRVLVLRVAEHEPSRPHTLEEVRDEIVAELRQSAAAERAREIGERVLDELHGGTDPQAVAAGDNLTWSDERTIVRERGGALSRTLIDALYAMPAPEGDTPGFSGVALDDGGYAVLALYGVGQAEQDEAATRDARERVERSLEAGYGSQVFAAVLRSLRQSADVEVLEQNLSQEGG